MEALLNKIKQQNSLLKEHHVEALYVFGSYARGDQTDESDLDLLVEFSQPVGLFEFLGLKMRLETILGLRIDLITRKALHPALKEQILKEMKRAA